MSAQIISYKIVYVWNCHDVSQCLVSVYTTYLDTDWYVSVNQQLFLPRNTIYFTMRKILWYCREAKKKKEKR